MTTDDVFISAEKTPTFGILIGTAPSDAIPYHVVTIGDSACLITIPAHENKKSCTRRNIRTLYTLHCHKLTLQPTHTFTFHHL